MQEWECTNCHTKNSGQGAFCVPCGAPLAGVDGKLPSAMHLLNKIVKYEALALLGLVLISSVLFITNSSEAVRIVTNMILSISLAVTVLALIVGFIPGIIFLAHASSEVGLAKVHKKSWGLAIVFSPIFSIILLVIAYVIFSVVVDFVTTK